MHFVALLDDRFQKTSRVRRRVSIGLRGYKPVTWVPSELSGVELPVYALAYNICPTHRDIYLEFVQRLERAPTWGRYRGRLIDETYRVIHNKCVDYIASASVRDFALYQHLLDEQATIISEVKEKHRRSLSGLTPSQSDTTALDEELKKIVRFEAIITSALMNFQIAKVNAGNARRTFNQYFNFNTQVSLRAPHQGFRADATPDFIYRNNVVGDIKSGKWQEFFYYTITAYALAYEEHTNENMDYGVVLHVEMSRRPMPMHFRTRIDLIDDHKRERFILVRNRKLEIIHDRVDPGLPSSVEECDPSCTYFSNCWENRN